MEDNAVLVEKLRAAFGDRALYLALLYRSFSQVLPAAEAEKAARSAIHEYGMFKGKADGRPMTPIEWVQSYQNDGGAALFAGDIVVGEAECEQRMGYCPLMAAWRALGCSEAEMDLLCDIAMEVDRGRADYHGIPWEITHRLAHGDDYCRLVLKNKA